MGYLALTNMGLGDKAAAFKLVERNMATSPIEKDAFLGPCSIEILARVAAGTREPDRTREHREPSDRSASRGSQRHVNRPDRID